MANRVDWKIRKFIPDCSPVHENRNGRTCEAGWEARDDGRRCVACPPGMSRGQVPILSFEFIVSELLNFCHNFILLGSGQLFYKFRVFKLLFNRNTEWIASCEIRKHRKMFLNLLKFILGWSTLSTLSQSSIFRPGKVFLNLAYIAFLSKKQNV